LITMNLCFLLRISSVAALACFGSTLSRACPASLDAGIFSKAPLAANGDPRAISIPPRAAADAGIFAPALASDPSPFTRNLREKRKANLDL
jgi:hypothetical protein